MQPYFFPYLGYFSLIESVDRWIAYDTPQFPREGWVHRNRILSKGSTAWKYIRVPIVKSPLRTSIKQITIDDSDDWICTLIRNLDYYGEARAPYYEDVVGFLKNACPRDERSLSAALIRMLQATLAYLKSSRSLEVCSALSCDLGTACDTAEQKVLRIAESVGATTYVNLPGGRELYDRTRFEARGIVLKFLEPNLRPYDQRRQPFIPHLSILDALMWKSPSEVLAMIRDFHVSS